VGRAPGTETPKGRQFVLAPGHRRFVSCRLTPDDERLRADLGCSARSALWTGIG